MSVEFKTISWFTANHFKGNKTPQECADVANKIVENMMHVLGLNQEVSILDDKIKRYRLVAEMWEARAIEAKRQYEELLEKTKKSPTN